MFFTKEAEVRYHKFQVNGVQIDERVFPFTCVLKFIIFCCSLCIHNLNVFSAENNFIEYFECFTEKKTFI